MPLRQPLLSRACFGAPLRHGFLVDPAIPFDVAATERKFLDQVLGQKGAVRAVVQVISLIKAGLSDARRPLGSFFFAGPTGVGKTHLAQLLAEHLFGSRERLIRFNMADYQQNDDAFLLFGSPNAYQVAARRGTLTMRLRGHQFAVLLLDEFEKAHPRVIDRFFQLIDEGAFINGMDETVSCRSSIVIVTSNAGAEIYRERSLGFTTGSSLPELDRELDRRLFAQFRHEFLNRFDHVVHFHPLSRGAIRRIAQREIEALAKRAGIRFNELALNVDEAVLDWLAVNGYDPDFGARHLKRCIERNVTIALAEAIVSGPVQPGSRLDVGVRGNRIAAMIRLPAAGERPTLQLSTATGTVKKRLAGDALRGAARLLVERAESAFVALQGDQESARSLLEQINAPHFWDDPGDSAAVLSEYRRLEILIGLGKRARQSCARVSELLNLTRTSDHRLERVAEALERASFDLEEWQRRRSETGPSEVWLLLHNADPLHPVPEWLEELVEMELAWCRRLQLDAEVVAYGEREGVLTRVVLAVSGPGAAGFLEMEHGLHRRDHRQGHEQRIRIHVFRDTAAAVELPLTSMRRRAGYFGLEVRHCISVERSAEGELIDFIAADRNVLCRFVRDFKAYLQQSDEESLTTARLYEKGGSGARDPRTGVAIARYKDAVRGRLDSLFEAYRQQRQSLANGV